MSRRSALIWAGILVAGTALVYWPILSLTLLSDDFGLVGMLRQKLAEEGGLTVGLLFAERWHETFANYRPLLAVSIALDEAVFGSNALGFHLTNLMLHGLAAFALTMLASALAASRFDATPSRARRAGLLAGAFFLVHPFHSETLAWIAARGDLLATLAVLFGLLAWERYRQAERPSAARRAVPRAALPAPAWLALSVLSFAGALLSKESALLTPLLPIGLDLWRRRETGRQVGWLRYARPHLLLIALIPLFLLARAWVVGGLIGEYGGASPFDPARLREFLQFLPQTVVSLILPINAETPRGFIPFARWSALLLGLVLFVTGFPLRRRRLLGSLVWTAAWWLITAGAFFPLFASGKGVTHYRLFYGPTAAAALLIGSWWAAASAAGGTRRRVATGALIAWITLYGITCRLDLRAYTKASGIVRAVATDLERIRSEVDRENVTFVVLDTPTIVRSAPVFGAYLPMAFGRWLRPEDPIALVPWLGAEPLAFLMAARRSARAGYVLRWLPDEHRLERVSAFLPAASPRPVDRDLPLAPPSDERRVWRWLDLEVRTTEVAAVAIIFAEARPRSGTLRLRTSEHDRFNPMPTVAFRTAARELIVVPAPPGEWMLAGELRQLELELQAGDELSGARLLGLAPEIEIVPSQSGPLAASDPAAPHRRVVVLRRRRDVLFLEPGARGPLWPVPLPKPASLRPAVDTVPEIPVLWYVERLAPDGRVVARSRSRRLQRSRR